MAENIIEDEGKNKIENVKKEAETNKRATIMGLSIWRILAYFIIYSIVGYIIETIFGIITKGVWESRQSFLYGPFCAIYGVGAVIMIIFLHGYSKKYTRLFLGGFIVGSIVEYLVSWIGEMILGIKWWDYSNMPLNINGRICFYYSIFWGILAIFLMKVIHLHIRRFLAYLLKKINIKVTKIIIYVITIFIIFDCIISAFAIDLFTIRMIANNNLDVKNKNMIVEINNKINESTFRKKLSDTIFCDKIMIITYPNLKVQQIDGSIVYFKDLLPDIKPYYIRFQDRDFYK